MNFWCAKGHFNVDQADFVKDLVNIHNPKYVLETGFCTGRSTSVILSNAKNLKKMISIDIDFDYMKPEGRQYQKLLIDNFPHFSTIENSSKIILNDNFLEKEFPNGIDLFNVDGDHSYEGCLFDLNSVYKHMNKNGIITIDDYKSGPPNGCSIPSVTNACDDFYKEHSYIEKQEWYNNGKGFCIFKF
jgi:predicted O-methyltransferase YrrM